MMVYWMRNTSCARRAQKEPQVAKFEVDISFTVKADRKAEAVSIGLSLLEVQGFEPNSVSAYKIKEDD